MEVQGTRYGYQLILLPSYALEHKITLAQDMSL